MEKQTIVIIMGIVIILAVLVGVTTIIISNLFMFSEEEISGISLDFDAVGEPVITWNGNNNEYNVIQLFKTTSNSDYQNIKFKFDFYNNNLLIGSNTVVVDKTIDGKAEINITTKLSKKPDKFEFYIINATKTR